MEIKFDISNRVERSNEITVNYSAYIPESLSDKLYNSIAKIQTNNKDIATGFFMKININKKLYHFLITYGQIFQKGKNDLEIIIIYGKKNNEIAKNLKLGEKGRFFRIIDNPIDIAAIQIIESDQIPEDKFLFPEYNYKNGYGYFENKNFCSVGYPTGQAINSERCLTFGKIVKIKGYEFEHSLDKKYCCPGSPICSIENCCVFGMLKNIDRNNDNKYGIFLGTLINILEGKKEEEYAENIGKEIQLERKKENIFKTDIEILDYIIKKNCQPNEDYYEFFNFLRLKNTKDYFINASIFDKNKYTNLKNEFSNKLNNKKLSKIEKACIGSILGMAIGDAIGSRNEFYPLNYKNKNIRDMGNNYAGKFQLLPGQWTDNTSMGLCIADSLIENGGLFEPRDIMMRLILWNYYGYNNAFRFDKNRKNRESVGLGGSIRGSFEEYIKTNGKNIYTKFGNIYVSGNGSLMRIAPIPICYFREEEKALEYSIRQSQITTQGIEAAECCKLITFIILKILKKKSINPIYLSHNVNQEKINIILNDLKDFKSNLQSVDCLANSQIEKNDPSRNWNWKVEKYKYSEYREKDLYIGSYCMDGLSMALNILYTTDNFKDAILKIANLGGDCGSIGSIVGQIAGAYYGLDSIPKEWVQILNKWDKNEIALRGYILCHLTEK